MFTSPGLGAGLASLWHVTLFCIHLVPINVFLYKQQHVPVSHPALPFHCTLLTGLLSSSPLVSPPLCAHTGVRALSRRAGRGLHQRTWRHASARHSTTHSGCEARAVKYVLGSSCSCAQQLTAAVKLAASAVVCSQGLKPVLQTSRLTGRVSVALYSPQPPRYPRHKPVL